MDQRCPKHGTFTGTTGCPWCKESSQVTNPQDHRGATKIVGGGGDQRGVKVMKKN